MDDKHIGYNPMRWDCEKDGCFNKKCRPKIEVFSECFPGKINFGDVDGIAEINKNFLMLEWKSKPVPIPTGQRILFERLTEVCPFAVIIIYGNAETMEISEAQTVWKGKVYPPAKSSLNDVKAIIKSWVKYAKRKTCQ